MKAIFWLSLASITVIPVTLRIQTHQRRFVIVAWTAWGFFFFVFCIYAAVFLMLLIEEMTT